MYYIYACYITLVIVVAIALLAICRQWGNKDDRNNNDLNKSAYNLVLIAVTVSLVGSCIGMIAFLSLFYTIVDRSTFFYGVVSAVASFISVAALWASVLMSENDK